MKGFIQIPQTWLEPKIINEPDFLRAVVYLSKEINENGSVDFSSGDAKLRFGMSPRRYRTFMALITNDKHCDKQATNKTTNITFECQVVTRAKRQATQQTSDKQNDKQTRQVFTPPTEQEVRDFVAERGFHFDPDSFIPFYESKGWKVGNAPMKDWRAACRSWEQRWKEKHGNIFYYQVNGTAKTIRPGNAAKASRDHYLGFASEIVSRSTNLANLYNGGCQDSDTGSN